LSVIFALQGRKRGGENDSVSVSVLVIANRSGGAAEKTRESDNKGERKGGKERERKTRRALWLWESAIE